MPELYIGLMSGTSMDGIDAALVDFADNNINLLTHHSHHIPENLHQKIFQLTQNSNIDLNLLGECDAELGDVFAQAVQALLDKSGYSRNQIQAIGSHGQTIWHNPDCLHKFSLQIADANHIAYHSGITTVADFRRKDMAAGGEGAPLAPAFHQAIFRSDQENRAVLNIGGVANLTCLPADKSEPCFGFDTGPGNILMDGWIRKHLHKNYDADGAWAASAEADSKLVLTLLKDSFIQQKPPKSTGREHYNLQWLNKQLKSFEQLPPEVIQASLCEFTAQSISYAIRTFLPDIRTLIVCGGGAHNQHLMQLLQQYNLGLNIKVSDDYGLAADWVEAAAFAWLARQTINSRPGNLPDVTGAERAVVLGAIYPA